MFTMFVVLFSPFTRVVVPLGLGDSFVIVVGTRRGTRWTSLHWIAELKRFGRMNGFRRHDAEKFLRFGVVLFGDISTFFGHLLGKGVSQMWKLNRRRIIDGTSTLHLGDLLQMSTLLSFFTVQLHDRKTIDSGITSHRVLNGEEEEKG